MIARKKILYGLKNVEIVDIEVAAQNFLPENVEITWKTLTAIVHPDKFFDPDDKVMANGVFNSK